MITGGLVPGDCSWAASGRAPGCLRGFREGAAPASSLPALAVEDEGFISEPVERFGVCLLSLLTRAITYIWNILPLLPGQLLFIFYVSV